MTKRISVVTTFNQRGYELYGSKMIDTYLSAWPKTIDLHVYAEDCKISQAAANLHYHDLHAEVPALVAFKNKWKDDPKARGYTDDSSVKSGKKAHGFGFRWDAIRFSHKVYAVCDHARRSGSDIMYWMDADMICHSPITQEFVESMLPETAAIAFLGRKKKFTECGLYALDLTNPATRDFIERFQAAYDDAENGIFTMEEWNDCWVFDRIRERVQQDYPQWVQLDWCQGTFEGEGHPLINTAWGSYLDHLKGERKSIGHSSRRDLRVERTESYWSRV